jgi:hypothetical protein
MGGRYTIYDPGRDEDYRLELNGIEFSSLAANVYGIHASGIDWTRVAFGLDTLFQSAGGDAAAARRPCQGQLDLHSAPLVPEPVGTSVVP